MIKYIRKAWRSFIGKGFVHNVAILISGTAVGQIIVFLSSPIITRLYSPEDLGVMSVFVSIVAFCEPFETMRYDKAILLAKEGRRLASLFVLCFVLILINTGIITILVIILGDKIAIWTKAYALKRYILLVPIATFFFGLLETLNLLNIRIKNFGLLAKARIAESSILVSIQVSLGWLYSGPIGLLSGNIFGRISAISTIAYKLKKQLAYYFKNFSFKEVGFVAKRFYRFPTLVVPSSLLIRFGLYFPPLLFSAFYGPSVAGLLLLSERVIGKPMGLLGRNIAKVYTGEAAEQVRKDPIYLRKTFGSVFKGLALVGTVPIVILIATGPFLFTHLFGDTWIEAGRYCQLLGISFLVRFIATPLSQTFNIIERQGLKLIWDISRCVVVNSAIMIAYYEGASAYTTIFVYSIAMFVMYFILMVLSYYTIIRYSLQKVNMPGQSKGTGV